MPTYADEIRLVAVPFAFPGGGGATANYCFRTSIRDSSSTELGHIAGVDSNGFLIAGGVFGANAPKPPRATKFLGPSAGSESSFFKESLAGTLRQNGWTIGRSRYRNPGAGPTLKPVSVDLAVNGIVIKYGWMMPLYQYVAIGGDRAALGIDDLDATEPLVRQAWFGCNIKPPRARKQISNGTIRTFYGNNKRDSATAAGWSCSDPITQQEGLQLKLN